MTISDRDRKILAVVVVVLVVGAYWFLLLSPKLDQRTKVHDELTQAQSAAQAADTKLADLAGAKRRFSADYQTLIDLGKAIPASLDMPSLLVQLYEAARGTGLDFQDIKPGARQAAPSGASTPASPASGSSAAARSTTPAAASAPKGDASATSWSGAATPSASSTSGVQGLDSVPLDFTFRGDFSNLADFLHQLKRFVQVVNGQIVVSGRLMTVNAVSFNPEQTSAAGGEPVLTAKVHATVYLAPKAQGLTAGATPIGPGTASAAPAPAAAPGSSSIPTPAATATP